MTVIAVKALTDKLRCYKADTSIKQKRIDRGKVTDGKKYGWIKK